MFKSILYEDVARQKGIVRQRLHTVVAHSEGEVISSYCTCHYLSLRYIGCYCYKVEQSENIIYSIRRVVQGWLNDVGHLISVLVFFF
jgi:hypothetical protein